MGILWLAIFDLDRCVDAAAHVEVAENRHLPRPACPYEIVEDLIDDGFMESSLVAVGPEVELERFKLDAKLVGHVVDANHRKIGLARARAHASELRTFHVDLVLAFGSGIGKSFEVFARPGRHRSILARLKCISKSLRYLDLKRGR